MCLVVILEEKGTDAASHGNGTSVFLGLLLVGGCSTTACGRHAPAPGLGLQLGQKQLKPKETGSW